MITALYILFYLIIGFFVAILFIRWDNKDYQDGLDLDIENGILFMLALLAWPMFVALGILGFLGSKIIKIVFGSPDKYNKRVWK